MDKSNRKKLAIIGTVGLPANYGGFETLTEHLVENISDKYEISVYCSSKKYAKKEQKKIYKGARLIFLPFDANGIQSIIYDTISILHSLFFAEILLILGVSGAWILPFVKLFTNKKVIISIDGIEWKRNKWSPIAQWYLWWAESISVKYSHFDISDNESIQDYTAQRYGSLSKVIEYGADHTLEVKPTKEDIEKYPILMSRYAFKVCRIEPENNVEMVLESFTKSASMPLAIVGNWENSDYGKQLKLKYKDHENINILDPIYNQRNLDLLRGNASLYIHGHSAGGTNPSLVEAMYLGLPIIAFHVSYNKTTTENKALYFSSTEELLEIMNHSKTIDLFNIGKVMKDIAVRRYSWPIIAKKYTYLFEEAFKVKKKSMKKPSSYVFSELIKVQATHLLNQQYFYER